MAPIPSNQDYPIFVQDFQRSLKKVQLTKDINFIFFSLWAWFQSVIKTCHRSSSQKGGDRNKEEKEEGRFKDVESEDEAKEKRELKRARSERRTQRERSLESIKFYDIIMKTTKDKELNFFFLFKFESTLIQITDFCNGHYK